VFVCGRKACRRADAGKSRAGGGRSGARVTPAGGRVRAETRPEVETPRGECPVEAATRGRVGCRIEDRVKGHERWGVASQDAAAIGS